jgi:hypothetical protein
MDSLSSSSDLERLAAEFLDRRRRGENIASALSCSPTSSYASAGWPNQAEELSLAALDPGWAQNLHNYRLVTMSGSHRTIRISTNCYPGCSPRESRAAQVLAAQRSRSFPKRIAGPLLVLP